MSDTLSHAKPSFTVPLETETTGRLIVSVDRAAKPAGIRRLLSDKAGVSVEGNLSDLSEGAPPDLAAGQAVHLPNTGLYLVQDEGNEVLSALQRVSRSAQRQGVTSVTEEEMKYALNTARSGDLRYVQGFRDGVNSLAAPLLKGEPLPDDVPAEDRDDDVAHFPDDPSGELDQTWGLTLTKAGLSEATGDGVRVAVLDTGVDDGHVDLDGRGIVSRSFIKDETAEDVHGHGTHCIGTVMGPRERDDGPGYGVAPDVTMYSGKVLSNSGRGGDFGILAGIEWALDNECDIISMSLGAPARHGTDFQRNFEQAAQRALEQGCVIVAAAGNDGDRAGQIVGKPANCPSVYAVGAIDRALRPASFSNPSGGAFGAEVDIAGPGVDVLSSIPNNKYARYNGTSMATPHIAGILALLAEAFPELRGRELVSKLFEFSKRLEASSVRAGLGLAMAPS